MPPGSVRMVKPSRAAGGPRLVRRGRRRTVGCCLSALALAGLAYQWFKTVEQIQPPFAPAPGQGPRLQLAAVLTAHWLPERAKNADSICASLSTVPCVIHQAPRLTLDQIPALDSAGYIEPYVPSAPHNFTEWWAQRIEVRKHIMYQKEPHSIVLLPSIANLVGQWSILAAWVAAGGWGGLYNYTEVHEDSHWLPPQQALQIAHRLEGTTKEIGRNAILIFEDDAIMRPGYEESILQLLEVLPDGWGLLDLDPPPGFCSGMQSFFWHPKRPVGQRRGMAQHRVYRSLVSYTRTTAMVISWEGAKAILAGLPTSLVVDLHVAKLLRLRRLPVYTSCDGLVLDASSFAPVRNTMRPA